VEFSLTNRLLAKDKGGNVSDLLSWSVVVQALLRSTFGGAVVPSTTSVRNVLDATVDITGYAFLTQPRHDSPIVSAFRYQSRVGVECAPTTMCSGMDSSTAASPSTGRFSNYFLSLGHNFVRTDQALAPSANQFRGQIG